MRLQSIILLLAAFTAALLSSCSTYQKITVFGEPGTQILTPDLQEAGTIHNNGKLELTMSRDVCLALLLSKKGENGDVVPFAIDYKNRSYMGARTLYALEIASAAVGCFSMWVYLLPSIISGGESDSSLEPFLFGGSVGAALGGFGGMVTSSRLRETQRVYQFEYLSKQSTNGDFKFAKFVDDGYGKDKSVDSNGLVSLMKAFEKEDNGMSSSSAKSRSSKSNRSLSDVGRIVEGTYVGSGKLLLEKREVETYQDIKVILKRLDKNTVMVDVYDNNDEPYFNGSHKYHIKKNGSGKYLLSLDGIPSATITIDSNKQMVYLHPKVRIDGDLYTLEISAEYLGR